MAAPPPPPCASDGNGDDASAPEAAVAANVELIDAFDKELGDRCLSKGQVWFESHECPKQHPLDPIEVAILNLLVLMFHTAIAGSY
jgi:hypothetical protein